MRGGCNDVRLKRKITNVSIMQVEAGGRERGRGGKERKGGKPVGRNKSSVGVRERVGKGDRER